MRFSSLLAFVFLATLASLVHLTPASAAIVGDGDVDPLDPTTWTSSTTATVGVSVLGTVTVDAGDSISSGETYVGYAASATGRVTIAGGASWDTDELYTGFDGNGVLDILGGAMVTSVYNHIGHNPGSAGEVTVSGGGSQFDTRRTLYIARDGANGTLTISGGGLATVGEDTMVGDFVSTSANSKIVFGAGGGALTTMTLAASPTQLSGNGTIDARGLISDLDLTFESASDLVKTIRLDSDPGQDVTINLDMSVPSQYSVLGVGWKEQGSLNIRGGTALDTQPTLIGVGAGAIGRATVSGAGTVWSCPATVGLYGTGILRITEGGTLNGNVNVGYNVGSTGEVLVSGAASTWTNNQSNPIGLDGYGTLTISEGGTVIVDCNTLGRSGGSFGAITVDGVGSTVTHNDELCVGYSGSGRLVVRNGGVVTSSVAYLGKGRGACGCDPGSGTATVNGNGSMWTNSGTLYVGYEGNGILNIADSGSVVSKNLGIYNDSTLAIGVGGNSQLTLDSGAGTITNDGTVRLIAGAGLATGETFAPILAGTWAGGGAYQGIGGTWDAANHVFTVSNVALGSDYTWLTIDLAETQRVRIHDDVSGWNLGASFLATNNSTSIDVITLAASDAVLDNLENKLQESEVVLSGWQIAVQGSYSGKPVYLSLDAAGNYRMDDLTVWEYSGSAWTEFDPVDLAYDGSYASFMISKFPSGYAVTAVKNIWIPGDANGDNRVDHEDAAALAAHWGQAGEWADGDFNGDGVVDMADASIMAANWNPGTSAEQGNSNSIVPEPSTLALLTILAAAAMITRRR